MRCALLDLFVWDVFDDIAYLTIQNFTERIDGFGIDRFTVLYTVQRIGGHALLEDQLIFCHAMPLQRFIKWTIRNHFHHQFHFNRIKLLTILNKLSIMVLNF